MKANFYSLDQYADFDSAYWGMGYHSSDRIFFGLCTHTPKKSAGLFSFDPQTQQVTEVANLTSVLHSQGAKQIQGKIHTPIIEGTDSKLYFGTHFAYPFGVPQEVEYEGGHFISYSPKDHTFEDFGIPIAKDGIITISLDNERMQAYILTIPSGQLIRCDIRTKKFSTLGKIPNRGSICRSITVDANGNVYGSYEDDGLFVYNFDNDTLKLHDNFFQKLETKEWDSDSRGGVNKLGRHLWRCATYDKSSNKIVGILAADSRVFSIDCDTLNLEQHQPLVPKELSDRAADIYPTLSLSLHENDMFYAPAAGLFDFCRSEKITDWTHLMSYSLQAGVVKDLGTIKTSDDQKIYGIAGATSGGDSLYFLGATEQQETSIGSPLHTLQDKPFQLSLIRIQI